VLEFCRGVDQRFRIAFCVFEFCRAWGVAQVFKFLFLSFAGAAAFSNFFVSRGGSAFSYFFSVFLSFERLQLFVVF